MWEVIVHELGNRKTHTNGDEEVVWPTLKDIDKHQSFPTLIGSYGRHSQSLSLMQNNCGRWPRFRSWGKGDPIDPKQKEFLNCLHHLMIGIILLLKTTIAYLLLLLGLVDQGTIEGTFTSWVLGGNLPSNPVLEGIISNLKRFYLFNQFSMIFLK